MALVQLPAEILQKIYSNLSYCEIYRLRSVCQFWKVQCEYQLYMLIKARQQKLFIKTGEKGRTSVIDMLPSTFDAENQVIEFRSSTSLSDKENEEENGIYMNSDSCRRMQIHFSEWNEKSSGGSSDGWSHNLTLADRALIMFHLNYNPYWEQVYQIPTPGTTGDSNRVRYMGDQGMVMTYSCIYPNNNKQQEKVSPAAPHFHGLEDSSSSLDDVREPTPSPIRLRVRSVLVNLSWLLAGMNPNISVQPIYANRYQSLDKQAAGIKKTYSPFSESVLEYIISFDDEQQGTTTRATTLLLQNSNIQEEQDTKLDQLKSKLSSIGIDPRMIWKYTFAKNYILRDQNNIKTEDVARVIQKSEQDWMMKKVELLRSIKGN